TSTVGPSYLLRGGVLHRTVGILEHESSRAWRVTKEWFGRTHRIREFLKTISSTLDAERN
ncbi:MAG: hypothetical protein WB988_06510, partial [Candidatus Nitrosopolaris sp.]